MHWGRHLGRHIAACTGADIPWADISQHAQGQTSPLGRHISAYTGADTPPPGRHIPACTGADTPTWAHIFQHPLGADPPNGHYSGRYTSYWNAFLFQIYVNPPVGHYDIHFYCCRCHHEWASCDFCQILFRLQSNPSIHSYGIFF